MTADRARASVRRGPGGAGLLVALLVVAVGLASVPLFVSPATDDPGTIVATGPVDAVVVLGGSPQARLDAALELLAALPDPPGELVLSVQYGAPILSCGSLPAAPTVPVRCFAPDPATTSGEAVWIAERAATAGWAHVVVVTSDTHVTRARVLVERCMEVLSPATVVAYADADTDVLSLRGAWSVATEWPSLAGAPWDHQPSCR